MKAAPIQLQQLSFRRVSVEVGRADAGADAADAIAERLAFDGVLIATHVGFAPMDDGAEPGRRFLLTLQVVIDNKPSDDGDASKPSPYLVDIEAGAVIRVAGGLDRRPDIEDIVVVNGTSMLWAAIREQVCNLTARMPPGMATLPAVHFQDLRRTGGAPPPQKRGTQRARPRPAKPKT